MKGNARLTMKFCRPVEYFRVNVELPRFVDPGSSAETLIDPFDILISKDLLWLVEDWRLVIYNLKRFLRSYRQQRKLITNVRFQKVAGRRTKSNGSARTLE